MRHTLALAALLLTTFAFAQTQPPAAPSPEKTSGAAPQQKLAAGLDTARENVHIGEIDLFGYAGLDVEKVRVALPIHEGQELSLNEMFAQSHKTKDAVKQITGHPATDVATVCCDDNGHWMIYIGLQGSSIKNFAYNPGPKGAARLPSAAMELEKQSEDAHSKAVLRGDNGEDDSKGYSLSSDPDSRAKQLAIREYTLQHEDLVREVLESSADVEQRQAAAEFLGYADQSQKQIDSLARASRDADSKVRNNATRALAVLAGSSAKVAALIPPAGFIEMLSSGSWTDRNKGTFLLLGLTKTRDPKLLAQLRAQAMPALIEMARWRAPGHAASSRILLGRIAGMEEATLLKMAGQNNQAEAIIRAAQNTK